MSPNSTSREHPAMATLDTLPQQSRAENPNCAAPARYTDAVNDSHTLVYLSKDLVSEKVNSQSEVGKDPPVPQHKQKMKDALMASGSLHISEASEVPATKPLLHLVDPEAVKMLSPEMSRKSMVLPIQVSGRVLTVAMADPQDLVAIDNLKMASGLIVKPLIWPKEDILEAIHFFHATKRNDIKIHESWKDSGVQYVNRDGDDEDVEAEEPDDAPTIQLLNSVLAGAIEQGASDIHIEPSEGQSRIRYRLDGVLHQVNVLPREMSACLISRIKILSSLDIAEKRVPQDGRFFVRYKEKVVDLRIATLPTIYGESCVIRLLDQSRSDVRIENLGFTPDQRALIVKALRKSAGLVLVTGPTGSGKTTTLCAMLNYVNSLEKKIITLEDPVEYRLDIVNHISRNPVAGLTYAAGLRAVLRNDPDIILVGEIRDTESASIAVQASLTGHLLLSTLHTTGAAESLVRLLDLGVEPFYVREVAELIVAQRLVRVLCEKCKQPSDPPAEVRESLQKFGDNLNLFKAVGCPECRGTGFKGRTAVFEVLPITEPIRRALKSETTPAEVRDLARKEGFKTFWEAAVEKVLRGESTFSEIRMYAPDSVWRGAARTTTSRPETAGSHTSVIEQVIKPGCSIHRGSEIIATCAECGRPLCNYCLQKIRNGGALCPQCASPANILCEAIA